MLTAVSLHQKLTADAALIELVSDRIFPSEADQDAVSPYIVWQRIGGDPLLTLNEPVTEQFVLVQFSCWARDFDACEALVTELIKALDNKTLSTGDSPTFQGPHRDMGRDPVIGLFRMDADFLI